VGLEAALVVNKLGGINSAAWTMIQLQAKVNAPGDVLLTLGNQHRKHSGFFSVARQLALMVSVR